MITMLQTLIPQNAERTFMAVGAAAGAALSWAFGDTGPLLLWLVFFVTVDFVTGFIAAWATSSYSSRRMFLGIAKKVILFWIVALAHGLDQVFYPLIHIEVFQSITICAYAAGEFGSIIENLERAGLGGAIPTVLRRLVRAADAGLERAVDEQLKKAGLEEAQDQKKPKVDP